MKSLRKKNKKTRKQRKTRRKRNGGTIFDKPLSEKLFNSVKLGQLGRLRNIIEPIEIERKNNNQSIYDIINIFDNNNKNLLYYAYDGGHNEIVDYLISKGARDDDYFLDNVLTNAIKSNDEKTIAKLIENQSSDVNHYQYILANSLYKNYQDERLNEKYNKIVKLLANELWKKELKSENKEVIKAHQYNPDIIIPEEKTYKFVDTMEVDIPVNDDFYTDEVELEPIEAIEITKNKKKSNKNTEFQPFEKIEYQPNSKIQKSIRFGGKRRGHRGTLVPIKKKVKCEM
jgi:hypothetical protein